MDSEQLLWNQYQQLSEEIKSADTLNYQVLGSVVAASVAIVNSAFARSSPDERSVLLLSVFAVTIPGAFLVQVARRRVWRVATYLEVFIEPALAPVKWQTRLTSGAKSGLRPAASNIIKTEFWLITLLDIIASTLNLATVPFITETWKQTADICIVAVLIAQSFHRAFRSTPRFEREGEVHCRFREHWLAVARSEDEIKSARQA